MKIIFWHIFGSVESNRDLITEEFSFTPTLMADAHFCLRAGNVALFLNSTLQVSHSNESKWLLKPGSTER